MGGESSDLLLKICHQSGGVCTVNIQHPLHSFLWALEIIKSAKKQIDAVGSMRWCMRLSLRQSLWLILRLRGWGFHNFKIKGEVVNVFISIATSWAVSLPSALSNPYSRPWRRAFFLVIVWAEIWSSLFITSKLGGILILSCHMIDMINPGKVESSGTELGHMSPVIICLWKTFASSCTHLHQLWWPLK